MAKQSNLRTFFVLWSAVASMSCADGPTTAPRPIVPPPPPPPAPPPSAISYKVALPAGKLPWPQHSPDFSQAQYDAMLQRLHIANNFALYQSAGTAESMYLHGGLDIVLPNGTPIYAIQSGIVRSISSPVPFYESILVDDASAEGHGWLYIHVSNFRVRVGDVVQQGTHLADVQFQGLEHVHLDRIRLDPGGSWGNASSHVALQPDTFFVYTDTEPPRFEGGFRYLMGGQVIISNGSPTTVSGDVDIAAGIRDVGQHARQPGMEPFNDRLAVSRLAYFIVNAAGDTLKQGSLDLTTAALPRINVNTSAIAQSIFAPYERTWGASPPAWWQSKTSFYVVTNFPAGGRRDLLTPADSQQLWDTDAVDTAGKRIFPNGEYRVLIRAEDFKGNKAERLEMVTVSNPN